MSLHDQTENSPEATKPRRRPPDGDLPNEDDVVAVDADSPHRTSWVGDIEQTLQLGEQFVGVVGGIVDLARVEALLAVRTLPKILMLWLLMIPVLLLTWCAFSALMAWSVYAASEQVGLGMLTFFLQQVLLLLICRWLFVKYCTRMSMPYTRTQIDNLLRSTQHGFNHRDKTKE